MAHPIMAPDRHPHCKDKFIALARCQKDHPIANLWGACSADLKALVTCCREEKKVKRAASVEKAKQDRERLMQKLQNKREQGQEVYAPGYGVGQATAGEEQPLAQ